MSKIPKYGTPDADSPEATPRDLALARRRDGTPVNPAAYARQVLNDLRVELDRVRGPDRTGISDAHEHIIEALKTLPAE